MDLSRNSYGTLPKHTVNGTVKISTHISAQSFRAFGQLVECSFTNKMIVGSRLSAVTWTSDFAPLLSNEMANIEKTKDTGFNLNFVSDMTKRYCQVHCKDNHSHLSSIIW